MTITELSTLRDFIRYATSQFIQHQLYFGHGTDNAWDEATALILHTLHLPHALYAHVLDSRLLAEEQEKLLHLINKRIEKRIPVAYLTHEAWFAQLPFYVDERVLIPRSPLAELIQQQFTPWIEADQVQRILDLGTGSGCIAIACAKNLPLTSIVASDISKDALTVAKMNVLRHQVEKQVELIQSDLFSNIQGQFDIIISNPPYVSQVEMDTLPAEYLHEPQLGLAAGKQGLDIVENILKHAKAFLTDHGILVVEVGNSEVALQNKYPAVPFVWLEFECGGDGVFLLTAKDVQNYF